MYCIKLLIEIEIVCVRMFLIFIKFVAIGVTLSNGIVLECDFVYHQSYWGQHYACIAKNLETTVENRTITEVKGEHVEGKTNDDVRKFLVEHGKCPILPLNVGNFFKSLEVYYVMKSAVKTLTNEDLKGLDKLRIFDVSYNPIERIERGFFNGKSSIKIISFFECALKFVDSYALDPLINLEAGHFEYNHCVDFRGDHKHLLPILKRHLKNCNGTGNKIDLRTPSDSDSEEEGMDSGEVKQVDEVNSHSSSTIDSSVHGVHFINECQMTFVGRNAFLIIILLQALLIIVGIVSITFVQYKRRKQHNSRIETHQLSEDF